MSKRPNLANIGKAAGSVHTIHQQEPEPVSASGGAADAPRATPATRAGTKPIAGHFPAGVRTQLKMLAAEKGRTMEDLLGEALNDLFAKYNKPELVPARGKASAA